MQVFEWVIHTDQYVYFLRYVKQKIVRVLNKKIQDQIINLNKYAEYISYSVIVAAICTLALSVNFPVDRF